MFFTDHGRNELVDWRGFEGDWRGVEAATPASEVFWFICDTVLASYKDDKGTSNVV